MGGDFVNIFVSLDLLPLDFLDTVPHTLLLYKPSPFERSSCSPHYTDTPQPLFSISTDFRFPFFRASHWSRGRDQHQKASKTREMSYAPGDDIPNSAFRARCSMFFSPRSLVFHSPVLTLSKSVCESSAPPSQALLNTGCTICNFIKRNLPMCEY